MGFDRTYSVLHLRSKRELTDFSEQIFREQGAMQRIGVDSGKLKAFIGEVANGYLDNPYHNFQHAVDTQYTMAWLLGLPLFRKEIPEFHKFLLLLVALVHDVGHPGHDNQWEVKTHSPLAKRFSNVSVIENLSLTITKELLEKPEFNVFAGVRRHNKEEIEELLSQLILCTDFSWHKVFVDELTEGVSRNSYDFKDPNFLSLICRTLIKAADISNTSKPYRQAKVWGRRVMNEFWAQGSLEKKLNLPVGPLNDPDKTEFNSTQAGFIKFAAYDLFALLSRVEEGTKEMLEELLANQSTYERKAAISAQESVKK